MFELTFFEFKYFIHIILPHCRSSLSLFCFTDIPFICDLTASVSSLLKKKLSFLIRFIHILYIFIFVYVFCSIFYYLFISYFIFSQFIHLNIPNCDYTHTLFCNLIYRPTSRTVYHCRLLKLRPYEIYLLSLND